ncbi:hypothetical protein DPMN_129944 [Dreissena polymorpha]|uniref:Uncharacterized protein n=1 Tax=Dreissena polymorpha TaxID=45954 RepID=A0A9D4H6P5_DREPO|nr:hypothetical protein DPMN_129944 [Dreissena polymorpha]
MVPITEVSVPITKVMMLLSEVMITVPEVTMPVPKATKPVLEFRKAYYRQIGTLLRQFPGKNPYLVSMEDIMRTLPKKEANPQTPDR